MYVIAGGIVNALMFVSTVCRVLNSGGVPSAGTTRTLIDLGGAFQMRCLTLMISRGYSQREVTSCLQRSDNNFIVDVFGDAA